MPLGVLPAPTHEVIDRAADWRPPAVPERLRLGLACGGLVLLAVAFVPPVWSEARRYEYVEAIQFALLAVAVPALLVLGAPWHLLGLARRDPSLRPAELPHEAPRLLDRVAGARRRHLGLGRSLGVVGIDVAAVVGWRLPVAVNGLARHGWLVSIEAACLVVGGVGSWLELVDSPPLSPRSSGPRRVLLAAIVMWTIWISAYLVGLSHVSVYAAYRHVRGVGLSLAADQEIATFVLWFAAAAVFVPVIFVSLAVWLRSEEDPDQGLYRLVRDTRRRAWTPAPGADPPAGEGEAGPTG